jgi:autotransporter-associated beta strand protein
LTKQGAGTLILSGGTGNSYGGLTTVNNGQLTLSKSSGNAIGGDLTISSAGTVQLTAANQIADTSAATVNGTLDLNNNAEVIGSLEGSGNVALGNAQLTAGNANNKDFSGVISGTGAFVKQGAGIQTFSGTSANTYSGLTTVNAGDLELDKTAGINAIAGALTIGGGSVKLLKANQIADASAVIVNGGSLNVNGFSETIGSLAGSGGGGQVVLGSGALTVNQSGSTIFNGAIVGIGGQLIKSGAGALELGGTSANTYDGLTTVSGGRLDLNKSSGTAIGGDLFVSAGSVRWLASGQIAGTAAVTVNGGSVNVNGYTQTIGSLAGSGGQVALGSGALTVNQSGSTIFNGAIVGVGGQLIKSGGGTLVLATSHSTYTGATTVNGGLLKIDTVAALDSATTVNSGTFVVDGTAADVIVNAGGYLKGSGTLTGNLTLSGGGFSPGNGPGKDTVTGNANWGANSWYDWEINSAGGTQGQDHGWDWQNITSMLTINAPFKVFVTSLTLANVSGDVFDFNSALDYTWTIATAAGGVSGLGNASLDLTHWSNPYSGTWSLLQSGNNVQIHYQGSTIVSVIPEPQVLFLWLAGVAALWAARRRRAIAA